RVGSKALPTARRNPTWFSRFTRSLEIRQGGARTLDRMIEVFGDSTRCGEWASVQLRLDGECIVDADAEGLAEDLRGLTLLEAAAVPGDDLATDALAAAIGPVFRAAA